MRDEAWPQWQSTATAALYLDVPESTLIAWRQQGVGPRWQKIGKRLVRYSRDALDEFARTSAGQQLAEPGPKLQRERADATA